MATVEGKRFTEWPKDLFIPPDALLVLLESFEGPLDLLYYLIKHQNLDILDIPIALVTRQYMEYIQIMAANRLELAADYLVMGAQLAEIKSRMLLPVLPSTTLEEEIEDPRQELVRKLQAYEQMKQAALALDMLERCDRDTYVITLSGVGIQAISIPPDVDLNALVLSMQRLLMVKDCEQAHTISRELYSTSAKMGEILRRLESEPCILFYHTFTKQQGRMGLVTSFMAILELARLSLIRIVQADPFSMLYVATHSVEMNDRI